MTVRSRETGGGQASNLLAETPLTEAPMLRSQVYERLRAAILSGKLPPGEKLSPAALAKSFGVSTMPIRDAIHLLEDEGLVETSARRWTRVVAPHRSVADELYPLVGLLEEFAIVNGPQPSAKQLAALRRQNRELAKAVKERDVGACLRADSQFHDMLIESFENRTLHDVLRNTKGRLLLMEGAFFRRDPASASVEQHDEVIAALAAGDLIAAGAAVRRNWTHGLEMIHLAMKA